MTPTVTSAVPSASAPHLTAYRMACLQQSRTSEYKVVNLNTLILAITATQRESELVRSFELAPANGQALPAFAPGAHLKVTIPNDPEPRSYSLVCLDGDPNACNSPTRYRLGVRLENPSKGGSQFMHDLEVGHTLEVSTPRNDFPLHPTSNHETLTVLIAGGIGITPIASMAGALKRDGRPYVLHYYGRNPAGMAFLDALQDLHGPSLQIHRDDKPDTHLPLDQLFERYSPDQHIYICGPKGLIDKALATGHEKKWPDTHLHFELFTTAAPQTGDRAFEVELRQSGLVFQIPADKTILEVLEENGCEPMYDCKRGECGVCQVDVLEGTPDHRDYYLTESERAENNVIHVCISRSLTDRLVLDL